MKRLFTRWLLMTALMVMSITTAVAQKSVLDESFESGNKPANWTAGEYWDFSAGSVRFNAPFLDGVDTLFSPMLNISSLDNKPSVAISYSLALNGDKVNELQILYRAAQNEAWSVLKTFNAVTDGQTTWKDVLPNGLSNVQIAIAGAYKTGGETRIYRIAVENKSEATTAPTGLGFEDLTTSGVKLEWSECTSTKFVQYNLKVSSTSMTDMLEEADVLDKVNDNLTDEWYELSGLEANTDYWFYVQYDCGDGDLSPWAEGTFHTSCVSINAPFTENFEGELSSCFTVIKNGSVAAESGEYAYNSTKSFKSNSGKGKYNYLILPEFSGEVKNVQVSFMAAAIESGSTYTRTVTVGVCTEATEASFTEVKTLNLPKGRTWESIVVTLNGYAGAGKYIAFRFGNSEKENRLFVDNIRIENATECPKPMFAEAYEIIPTSAKLKWTEAGDKTEWNLVLSTKPLSDPEDLLGKADASKGEYAGSTATNPHTAANLLPNTMYYAYLSAACGSSGWTNAVEFKTAREVGYPYEEHFDRMASDRYTDDKNAIPEGWVMDSRGMNPIFYYDKYLDSYLPYVKKTYNHEQTAYVNASLRLGGTKAPEDPATASAYYSSIAMTPAMPKAVKDMTVTFWAYSENGMCDVIIGVADTQDNGLEMGYQLGKNIITVDSVHISAAGEWTKCVVDLKKYKGTGRYIAFYISTTNSTPTVYIDDITIEDTPDCSAVLGLSVTAMNTKSIKATWTDNTSTTKWKVKVSTKEIDPATEDGDVVASTTVSKKEYTRSGLLMGTKYYVYVSPNCGDFWESANATTGVGIEVPYFTDFTITNPAYKTSNVAARGPEFWTLGNTYLNSWTTQNYVPYLNTSGWTNKPEDQTTPYLYLQNTNASGQQSPYAIMPELQNASVKDLKISFYAYWNNAEPTSSTTNYAYKKDKYYGVLKVGVVSSPADINTSNKFNKVTQVAAVRCKKPKEAEYFVVDMSGYTGSGKYIVFYQDTAKNNYMCVDNLSITLASAPQKVTDVTVSDITKTGAKLNWTKNDNATKWNIKMFTSKPTDPDTDEAVKSLTVTSKPTTITGLSHSTQYYAYVQSVIGEEAGAWSSVNFYTECDTWAVPFFEGFESYGTGANTLSPCYTQTANAQVCTESTLNLAAENKVGGNAFKFNATSSVKTPTLVFPTFDKPINTLQLTMKANPYMDSYAGKGSYTEIGVMEAGDNFVKVGEFMFDQADKKNWQECYINFSSYAGPGGRIAIRCVYDAVNTTIHVGFDDIRIEELPACGRISSMTITGIDSLGATLSWTKGKNESAWNLKVSSKAMDDPDEETADGFDGRVTAQTKLLNTLDDNTTYYAYVQPVDEVQSCVGGWSRAFSFKTLCRKQAFPYMEDFESYTASSTTIPDCSTLSGEDQGHSYISTSKGTNNKSLCIQQKTKAHKNYFVFPALQIDSVKRLQLTMDVWIGTSASYIDQFEIGVMTDPNDPATFKATHVESRKGQSAVISGVKYSFADYTGGDDGEFGTYIAIKPTDRLKASDNSVYGATTIYIDNVTIDFIETCPKPSNVQIATADIGPETAKVTWESESPTTLHRVRVYANAKANPDVDVPVAEATANGTEAVVSGLASTHDYYAFVRAECGENNFSRWSTACSFRTKCAEVTGLPYEEGFEAYAASVVPDCWTQIPGPKQSGPAGSSTQAFAKTNAAGNAEGVMGLQLQGSSINQSTSGLNYAYSNAAIITPKLDVDDLRDMTIYFDVKGSTEGASLKIEAVSNAVADPTDVEYLLTLDQLPATWTKAYIKLSDYYTSAKQLQYIRFTNAADGKSTYIDNIVFTLEPNVVLPVANILAKKVSHESVSFSFDEKTPGINAWQVAYVASGGNVADATIFGVDTTAVTINNLTSETSYDIYVRSENTEWVGPLTMTTCDIPATLPYSTGWEDDQENAKWKIYNVKTVQGAFYPNYFVLDDAANCGATGNKALYITNDGSTYAYTQTFSDVWATRMIDFTEPGSYKVSFRVKVWGNQEVGRDDAFWAQLMPAGATIKAATATLVDGSTRKNISTGVTETAFPLANKVQYLSNREWATITKVFDIKYAGEYLLALSWTNSGVGKPDMPLAVDSVIVEEYLCTDPSKVEWVNRSGDEVTLKWFGGKNKKFEYVVSEYKNLGNPVMIDDADKVAYGIVNDGPQVTISNLLPSTQYSFYVRTLCDEGETDWIEFDFATPCMGEDVPYTENFANDPKCWTLNSNAQITTVTYRAAGASEEYDEDWSILRLSQNGLAILPELNVPLNKVQVEIGAFNGYNQGTVILGTVDNSWDPSTFKEIAQFTPQEKITGSVGSASAYTLETFIKMLNLYQGTGKLLALKNTGAVFINIKYVTLTELPDCIQPQKVEMTGITENSATIHWIAGTEEAWEIQVDKKDPIKTTTNPYVLTGLEQGVNYTVVVRAVCDNENKSEWSMPATFRTTCGVNPLPLIEDFSGLQKGKKAALRCWDNMVCDQNIEAVFDGEATLIANPSGKSATYSWKGNDYVNLGGSDQLLSLDNYNYTSSYAEYKYRWFISPQYAIEGDATLSFDARFCKGNGTKPGITNSRFFVAISTDNGATWRKADAKNFTDQLDTIYSNYTISLEKYVGQNIRVAFYHEGLSSMSQPLLLIDNVRMNCTDEYPISDGACQGVDYNDNGFNIKAEDLPIAGGKDSTYYRFAANTATGCDSIVALTLTTHKPADLQPIYDTICQGEVYHFGGQSLTKSNPEGKPYYISGKTSYGCDSTIYLYLTVLESDTIKEPIQVSKLNTDSYVVDPYFTIPAKAAIGVPFDTIVKADGCNFNRYHVEINQCTEPYAFADSICDSQLSYKGYGFSIKKADMPEAGSAKSYERHAMNEIGCDSVITFSLFVVPNDTTEIDTVVVWNKDLLHADYPVDELFTIEKNTPVGAFDTVVLIGGCSYNLYHIAVKQCTRDAFYADTICANETSYVGYGFTLEAGQLPVPGNTKEFKNNDRTADECDSTTTLNLYVRPLVHNDKYITKENTELPFTTEDGLFTIKAGTSVGSFDTVVYTNVGCDYNIYHVTIEQCEEEINLPLVTICENETSYKGFGFSINADEMPAVGSTKPYVRHAMNEAGCDSVITLRLKVLENDTTPNQVTIFNNELPFEVDDYYKVPADALIDTPFDTIVWTEGCSYNLYHVLVNRCTVQKKYNAEVCEGDEVYNGYGFSIEKAQWPATGISKDFTNVTRTADQCDSTTTLTLMVVKADTNNIDVPIDNTMLPYTVDNYYEVPATTAVGADYYELVRIDGCAFNLYHVTVAQCEKPISYNETICEDADGYVGYGFSIEKADLPAPLASKEYVRHAMDNANCDSVITLTLTAHNDTTNVPVSILITKLPFEVDEWYTVPADAQVGEQFEVVKQKGTDCAYNRYIVMVSACGSQIEYKDTVCADQTSYDGFGFSIEAADMPAPGSFKSYYRNEPKGDGCDHITFTLTVMKNDTTNVPVTILNNELPFEVDAFYTVPENTPLGSFEKIVKLGDNGCSYNKYIVTINQCIASYNFADAVCESQTSYLDNGFSIEEADMPAPGSYKDYTRHELTAQGCDSTITLRLMVTKNDTTPVPVKILNNELPFEVDAYYTVPENTPLGSFEKVVKLGDEGCSYNKYMVTIHQCTASSVFTDAICESQMSYDGYGFSIEKADMPAPGFSKNFIRHETTAQGCDSTITLKLEIIPNDTAKASVTKLNTELPFVVDEYFTILAGTPVGSFDTVVVKDGCSYKRYSVTIIQETKAYSEASAVCEDATGFEGFGFSIEEADMPAAGTSKNYTRHALNEAGVDSVITFTLSVTKNDTAFINDTIFNNELPYIAQGETIVAAGVAFGDQPTKVLANNGACSYTSYSIFVEQCTASFASVDSICAGSEYSGYGFQIALADMPAPGKSKLYERHETTLEGCDSLISLTLKVMKMDTTKYAMIEIKNNQLPYEIDRYYTVPEDTPLGIHEAVVVNPEKDCAFYRYRYNIVQCSDEYKFTDMICIGSDYAGYGFVVAKADKDTVLTRTSMGAGGCDSIITLTLTVELPDTNDIVKEVLNSELPFIAQNETIVAAGAPLGIQPEVILPAGNCAYNRYIITVTQCSNSFSYKGRVCDGEGYEGFGFILPADSMPAAGESKDFFRSNRSAAGCDSLITLTLTVSKLDTIDVEKTIQKNELPFIANGDTIIAAGAAVGVQPEVIKQGNGCMYNRYIITVIACEIYADLTDEACVGSDYKEYGFDIKASEMPVAGQSKEYTRTSKDAAGCDSIITLTLTVKGDTTYLDPIEINEDQLPYQVNEFITIPAGTPVGVYEEVIRIPGDCQFIAYTVTIHEQGFGIIHITDAVESIEVYDLLGHKITTIRSDEEAKSLPTGVYMLRSIMKSGQIVNSKAALK